MCTEEVLYDIESMRRFVGIDLGNEPVPDETTICKFRHLLETDKLGERIFTKGAWGAETDLKRSIMSQVVHRKRILLSRFRCCGFQPVLSRGYLKYLNL